MIALSGTACIAKKSLDFERNKGNPWDCMTINTSEPLEETAGLLYKGMRARAHTHKAPADVPEGFKSYHVSVMHLSATSTDEWGIVRSSPEEEDCFIPCAPLPTLIAQL